MNRRSLGQIFIGTAGWSIPPAAAHNFDCMGTHLQKYAAILTAAEINSSFYRSHELGTYREWASATPREFRFAIKLPRTITHDHQFVYFRLHGSPRNWSRYSEEYIDVLAKTLKEQSQSAYIWCIFDNTASGAAIENALELHQRLVA